jgi:hypothetical protein
MQELLSSDIFSNKGVDNQPLCGYLWIHRKPRTNTVKIATAIHKILASDATVSLKISKLQTLALRCYPSSPNQKTVTAAYQSLQTLETARALYNARITAVIEQDFRNGPQVNDADFNYRHGWITVNGQSFCGEMLFPEQHWPRCPADQGCSD